MFYHRDSKGMRALTDAADGNSGGKVSMEDEAVRVGGSTSTVELTKLCRAIARCRLDAAG